MKNYKIAVAGTGYVGLSLGVLLSQHHQVVAVDIVQAKVDMINNKKSPIQDDYIEKYLAEKDLNLTATLDAKAAYSDADFVVIAAPTNYDSKGYNEKYFKDKGALIEAAYPRISGLLAILQSVRNSKKCMGSYKYAAKIFSYYISGIADYRKVISEGDVAEGENIKK